MPGYVLDKAMISHLKYGRIPKMSYNIMAAAKDVHGLAMLCIVAISQYGAAIHLPKNRQRYPMGRISSMPEVPSTDDYGLPLPRELRHLLRQMLVNHPQAKPDMQTVARRLTVVLKKLGASEVRRARYELKAVAFDSWHGRAGGRGVCS